MEYNNYKLAAYDLDGTFINEDQTINQSCIDGVKKLREKGVINVICSGRSIHLMYKYIRDMQEMDYIIAASGASIYDRKNDSIIKLDGLNNDDVRAIATYVKQIGGNVLGFFEKAVIFEKAGVYLRRKRIIDKLHSEGNQNVLVVDNILDCLDGYGPIEKITIRFNADFENEVMQKINEIGNFNLVAMKNESNPSNAKEHALIVEINAYGVSKAEALEKICDIENINIKDTVCFGDSDNDIPVMSIAGASVAMGNAGETVKEMADYVAKRCDEDGVYDGICHFFGI